MGRRSEGETDSGGRQQRFARNGGRAAGRSSGGRQQPGAALCYRVAARSPKRKGEAGKNR